MSMNRLRAKDLQFYFGCPPGLSSTPEPERQTCPICDRRFNDHGCSVWLEGSIDLGTHIGVLCGSCLTSTPKRIAHLARERAPILRDTRPRRGDDDDTNIKWADDLLRLATLFNTLDSLDAVPGGTLARKIGEGYGEMDDRKRTRKAA